MDEGRVLARKVRVSVGRGAPIRPGRSSRHCQTGRTSAPQYVSGTRAAVCPAAARLRRRGSLLCTSYGGAAKATVDAWAFPRFLASHCTGAVPSSSSSRHARFRSLLGRTSACSRAASPAPSSSDVTLPAAELPPSPPPVPASAAPAAKPGETPARRFGLGERRSSRPGPPGGGSKAGQRSLGDAPAEPLPVAGPRVSSAVMLLRLRGPDGMLRLTVEATTTFGQLGQQVGAPSPGARSTAGVADEAPPAASLAAEHRRRPDRHHVQRPDGRRRQETRRHRRLQGRPDRVQVGRLLSSTPLPAG